MVATLARTARVFYHTWRENSTSICQAVASRTFSNLTDAERLLDIQEEAEAVTQSQDSHEKKSTVRAKRLLFNARCASAASNCWVNLCQIHECFDRKEDPHMRPSEIARFEHAFYCVWAIGVMGTTLHLQERASAFLDECSSQELCRLDELSSWAMYFNDNNFGSLGLDLHDEIWKVGCDLVSKRWITYQEGRQGIEAPDFTPLNFFAFFDNTQRYLDLIDVE